MQPSFKEYQHQVVLNAKELAMTMQENGLTIFSGGTDNHLMLVDLRELDVTGLRVQNLLDSANITANKNAIPFDTRNKAETSGMRFGTPASTTRGMKEPEMRQIGNMIARIIKEGDAAVSSVKEEVLEICKRFPLYQ
jgi:glycine hydroxymethyltransferase